ncbi:MAG: hypothetical protein B6I31_03730 [Desulfobacteraceae bacterium 4572_19]|nr:MAG: hypothetical protein B6I31_03730 [Desulfobacteraceae bacterium 4572_19]
MQVLQDMYERMIKNMGVPDLKIPFTAVKFYKQQEHIPKEVLKYCIKDLTVTSCQADRQASLGDAICLTKETIGCVAAAISFGLVDQQSDKPISDSTVYTDIMKQQSGKENVFTPPTPKNFTDGIVYACKDASKSDFALFGKDDAGRYKDVATAKNAIKSMSAIQPADTAAVFFYSYAFNELDVIPDVIVLSVRPVELTRIIQAYQYNTGKRVDANMGGLRVVNSDLIVRPYLTGKINISTYCLGARLIAKYDGNRLGIGIPYREFQEIAQGMEDSRTGFPFHMYPGA